MSDKMLCGSCRFFLRDEDSEVDEGDCRRNPPVIVIDPIDGQEAAAFPLVPASWWCGELRPVVH